MISNFYKPLGNNYTKCVCGESIELIPTNTKYQYIFRATGKVIQILKDKDFDIVRIYAKPLFQKEHIWLRDIVMGGNHGRRQELTLKLGQYADFYGRAFLELVEVGKKEDGSPKYIQKWRFIGFACQGWYTPTAFDVKRLEKEREENQEEENNFFEITEKQKAYFCDILDTIEEMKEEDKKEKLERRIKRANDKK